MNLKSIPKTRAEKTPQKEPMSPKVFICGSIFGATWTVILGRGPFFGGPSPRHPPWGAPSRSWEHLGTILGPSWAHSGSSWAHLESSWGHLKQNISHIRREIRLPIFKVFERPLLTPQPTDFNEKKASKKSTVCSTRSRRQNVNPGTFS